MPGSVQSLVQARTDRLDPADKKALQAASVLGQRFAPDAWPSARPPGRPPELSGAPPGAAAPGEAFLFAHALVRDAVYDTLLKSRRRALHRRAAEWFAERDPVL